MVSVSSLQGKIELKVSPETFSIFFVYFSKKFSNSVDTYIFPNYLGKSFYGRIQFDQIIVLKFNQSCGMKFKTIFAGIIRAYGSMDIVPP